MDRRLQSSLKRRRGVPGRIAPTGRALVLAIVLASLVVVPLSALWAAPPVKRARPPKFDKTTTDAFFPDAREKLVGSRPQRSTATAPIADGTPVDSPARAAAPGGGGWKSLIAAETIEDEIKTQQVQLLESVRSATKFKGGDYQQARVQFSMLATLLAIDAQYDEPMRWKREAPAMRDRMARAGFNCKVGTDASYKDAKAGAEELEGLVRGGTAQLPSTAGEPAWPKIADRAPLMKRLEQAQQLIAPWTANNGEFSRHADKLAHEAQLVAALAQVISREGYEYADDESYREQARALEAAAVQLREGVEQKNFEQGRQAAGEIGKACSKCHEGFRS